MGKAKSDSVKIINGTHIRVKSVFGDIPLEKALGNLVQRRISDKKTT